MKMVEIMCWIVRNNPTHTHTPHAESKQILNALHVALRADSAQHQQQHIAHGTLLHITLSHLIYLIKILQ